MPITVRSAEAQDQAALQRLFLSTRRQTYTWMDVGAFRLTDLEQQTRGEAILVAEDELGAIAGFIAIWEPDHFIHHLYVVPSQQRRGVGRALLAALPGWPVQKYSLKCLLLNHVAATFYRANGFVEAGREEGEDGEYAVFESGNDAARDA
ncbi:acetyltransferase [Collimonas arenae]|uniref:Acetyltransferase n=1 Tax=Collimonas arenae TaxID=279058 RepID=A0A0A1FBJ5_9BURK|nr:GNAT family N-acetyltransferase [Collimonas arenae]AIY41049.1 acetyltransferase [Collimonas arenae]